MRAIVVLWCVISMLAFALGAGAGYASQQKQAKELYRERMEFMRLEIQKHQDEAEMYRQRCVDWSRYVWRLENDS